MDTVSQRLDSVAQVLPAIAQRARAWMSPGSVALDGGALFVGHEPTVAPEYYRVRIFPPAPRAWFDEFETRLSVSIPLEYRRVLETVNGCSCIGLDLFGLAGSTLLDRRSHRPLQLALAVSGWAAEYGRAGEFHFGGAPWTEDVNCGYFWGSDGPFAALPSGRVLHTWRSLPDLLAEEIARLEGAVS